MNPLVYLIDTFSLVFQVFHAIPTMTGPKGEPTNAVFGFARDILAILNGKHPTHLICAMESTERNLRNDLFEAYKSNRTEMPNDLRPQIPLVLEMLAGFRIPVISHNGWEADDVIATLAHDAAARGMDVRIVTSDKDARQLLGPRVEIYNCRKNEFFNVQNLQETWGIRPDQVIDFQSLVGDSVDNVPGIPLVGPKKAAALLQEFHTLEGVLDNADRAPGAKLRENLKNYREQALVSRKLVTLNTQLPLEVNWDALRVQSPDHDRLLAFFQNIGFKRLSDEMRAALVTSDGPSPSDPSALSGDPQRQWLTIDTPQAFGEFLKELRKQREFYVDLETTDLDAVRAEIVGWAISWRPHLAYYLPVDAPPGQPRLDRDMVLSALKPLLEDDSIRKSNQNIKYDMLVLRRAGVRLEGIGIDPMVGDYLLDAGARSHGLDALAERYLNHKMIPITDLIGSGKQQIKMFEVDVPKAAEYAAEDADIALQVARKIEQQLREEDLWDLYWNLERPLIPVLAEMEFTGIRVDAEELRRQSATVEARLTALVREIHDMAGGTFNIDSPKQLSRVLFDELKLPVIRKTKTGASTDQEVLEKLALQHPLPKLIMEHRTLSKLKGTYLDALPQMINPTTGRIHCSFNQVVAATGRLSSSDPNLQNIPIRTQEGRQVRRAFIPGEAEQVLVCADYSQIELRMLAHFSGDEALRAAFRDNVDIHTAVAAEIFNISPADVDSDRRRVAKAVNFGVIYGQSAYGLSESLGIPRGEAQEFIENYFQRYSGVASYITKLLEECVQTGFAKTILGRRRAISGIQSTTGFVRNLPERTAVNTVIQGSAADLIKKAMIGVHARLLRGNLAAKMLLQIHDELVFEVRHDQRDELIAMVKSEMQSALDLHVPLVVDVKSGLNWLDAEPVV